MPALDPISISTEDCLPPLLKTPSPRSWHHAQGKPESLRPRGRPAVISTRWSRPPHSLPSNQLLYPPLSLSVGACLPPPERKHHKDSLSVFLPAFAPPCPASRRLSVSISINSLGDQEAIWLRWPGCGCRHRHKGTLRDCIFWDCLPKKKRAISPLGREKKKKKKGKAESIGASGSRFMWVSGTLECAVWGLRRKNADGLSFTPSSPLCGTGGLAPQISSTNRQQVKVLSLQGCMSIS